jgi:NAD(P)-dependent dehydrogenase (short-subunit alcohol dehydrogenase family)
MYKYRAVLVTGSNRGIGKGLVQELINRNAEKIYACARDVSQLPDFGSAKVIPVQLDITDDAAVARVAAIAADANMLINNAGVVNFQNPCTGNMDLIRHDIEVNFFGTLRMMRAFLPILEKNADPVMINVGSTLALVNLPSNGAYSISKAALWSLTQGARMDYARRGIAVHSANPAMVDTDMTAGSARRKATIAEAAKALFDGFEAGEPDIFPDRLAKASFEMWKRDYLELERTMTPNE